MGEETFQVYKLIKQKGDDGLPRHIVQVDVEDKDEEHILRFFMPVPEIKQLFFENNI